MMFVQGVLVFMVMMSARALMPIEVVSLNAPQSSRSCRVRSLVCFINDPESQAALFQSDAASYDGKGHELPNDDGFNKANRFSKFAPDTNLSTEEFRSQLKENMKADLEKRRRESPNRGNQPAKSYLDSL